MKPKSKENKNEKRRRKRHQITPPTQTPTDLAFTITRTAVSQICKSVGLKKARLSALETLTHITTLYIKTLTRFAASYANASNRTQSNLFDIINALQDIGLAQGFVGGSTLHASNYSDNCAANTCLLSSSSVLKDLRSFVNSINEVPFERRPIPGIGSVVATRTSLTTKRPRVESLRHIPRWLPDFPEEGINVECEGNEGVECGNGSRNALWENNVNPSPESVVVGEEEGSCGGDLVGDWKGRVRFNIGGVQTRKKAIRCGVELNS